MEIRRKPDWLKIKLGGGENYPQTKKIVEQHHLHTICSSGKCPNIGECWSKGTATFMILGEICTRSCKFCATKTGKPLPVDVEEPARVAESVRLMNLKHCVITSVDRDDLDDKGAKHWADTITEIRNQNPNTIIEILVPDFDANKEWIDIVLESKPDVYGHNMETVERLSNQVRSRAKYPVSLEALRYAAEKGFITKSGIMVGLGETKEEVVQVMKDLRTVGCRLFTIGQYLQPTPNNLDIVEYVTPEQFAEYKKIGMELGFDNVEAGPLVRSSYMAEKTFLESHICRK
ncbi:MAG: lipoyl synthase [Bacteroidales bacterium]|nr:lipoyl synthase [Bacteroidales bacterium]MBR5778833.1 lipoyl synthase [Bacteroidales bacterium]